MSHSFKPIVVIGPEQLENALFALFQQQDQDDNAKKEHYLLYQLGYQQSLIKVDFSQQPYKFWHCDLMGRPATAAVKDTIKHFIEATATCEQGLIEESESAF